MLPKNYYLLLGVNPTASNNEIKTAYRELAKKYHPDKNYGNKVSEDYFKEVQEAYSVLANQGKRKKYDLSLSFGNNYYQTTENKERKSYTQYTGNAYQYAQQEAYHHQQNKQKPFTAKEYKEEKPDKTERYQLLICVVIALILLFFICRKHLYMTITIFECGLFLHIATIWRAIPVVLWNFVANIFTFSPTIHLL